MASGGQIRAGKAYVEIGLKDRVQKGLRRISSRLRGVTSATGKAFDALNEQAKRLGRTTSLTAAQVAEGMLNLGRVGFSAGDALPKSQFTKLTEIGL